MHVLFQLVRSHIQKKILNAYAQFYTTAYDFLFKPSTIKEFLLFFYHGWIEHSKYPRKNHRVSGPRSVSVWRDWPKVTDDVWPPRRPLNPINENLFVCFIKIRRIVTIFENKTYWIYYHLHVVVFGVCFFVGGRGVQFEYDLNRESDWTAVFVTVKYERSITYKS